jgi:ABC-type phosphate transport system auxiliary subunit
VDSQQEQKVNKNLESLRKKREQKQVDKQMIDELKKELPVTESQ